MQKEDEIIIMTDTVRVRQLSLEPGDSTPWHFHNHVVDTMYGLSGRIEVQMRAPDQYTALKIGQHCQVDTGRAHRVLNVGDGTAVYLLIQGVGEYDFNPLDPPGIDP